MTTESPVPHQVDAALDAAEKALAAEIRCLMGPRFVRIVAKALEAYELARLPGAHDPDAEPAPGPDPEPDLEPGPPPRPDPEPTPSPAPRPKDNPFRLFQDISYKNGPDYRKYGFETFQIIYERAFFGNVLKQGAGDYRLPPKATVESLARAARGDVILDIERYWDKSDETFDFRGVEAYAQVVKWFRAAATQARSVSVYGSAPIRNYWDAVDGPADAGYKRWQDGNDSTAPLVAEVDHLFPSIYTFYKDRAGWKRYAKAQIDECRRIAPGKKAYAFLWPEYHVSNADLKGLPIEADYWREQLEWMHQHADGVVIWTLSDTKKVDFADIPPWWQATLDFIDEHGLA